MTVMVAGYRNLLEPPVMGVCQDPECITMAAMGTATLVLVASYRLAGLDPMRVCASCDERILRSWLADDEPPDVPPGLTTADMLELDPPEGR